MRRFDALGPRALNHTRLAIAVLPALLMLASCGPSQAPPSADPFQPTRPTNKGSMADAVRQAHERSAGVPPKPIRQIVAVTGQPDPAAQSFEPEPPPDANTTHRLVLDYLGAMDALLQELEGVANGNRGESLASVAAKSDQVRASLDQLVSVPLESRRAIDSELGDHIARVRQQMEALVETLRRHDSRQPIVNLVADLRLLD